MPDHFDALETRDPEARERDLLDRLPKQVAHAKANAPGFARIAAGSDSDSSGSCGSGGCTFAVGL